VIAGNATRAVRADSPRAMSGRGLRDQSDKWWTTGRRRDLIAYASAPMRPSRRTGPYCSPRPRGVVSDATSYAASHSHPVPRRDERKNFIFDLE
jgi:hypothetical protein